MDDAVNLLGLEWNGWEPCHSVVCECVRVRVCDYNRGGKGKERLKETKEKRYMAVVLPHTLKQLWKCPEKELRSVGRWQVPFTAPQRGFLRQGITFAFIITFFPKQQAEESGEGWCRLGSLSTSPARWRPSHALPLLPDSSPAHPNTPRPAAPSAHIEQSLTAVTWEGYKPACRYCSYFQIPIVSCRWCPYVLPLCISRQKDFVLVLLVLFLPFSFPLRLGWAVKSEQRTLVDERKPRILLVWFVVSILMKWNPSCRIFCMARIVRQWEDGGAIWREFSYWMEPHQLPIGCHII